MIRRRVGRAHFTGPDAWPDHVLSYEIASLIAGAVLQVRGWALGFEIHGRGGNPWAVVYLGPYAFEAYFDRDRSWDA